jgi:hypothetical protein
MAKVRVELEKEVAGAKSQKQRAPIKRTIDQSNTDEL